MKLWQKCLLVILSIYGTWLLLSIIFLFVNIPLFHYGNLIGKTYKVNYYPLEDWDYPLNAEADFNGDGKVDYITGGGCAHFNSTANARPGIMCSPYYSNKQSIDDKGEYPYHSYIIKEQDKWYIIVFAKDYSLSRYVIGKNGSIVKMPPTTVDLKNEAIYLLPLIPIWILYTIYYYLLLIPLSLFK